MRKVTLLESRQQEKQILEAHIKSKSRGGLPLCVLEAGCGHFWPLDMTDIDFHLTGIDLDTAALKLRKEKRNDLDDTIIDDLTTVQIPENTYDVIYNSFVLEHIQGAEGVLDRFCQWLKPGGCIIIRIPDRDTVYGMMTRLTPHWVHVMYKKYVAGLPDAGKPGIGPYPTYHDQVVSRRGIQAYCERRGLKVVGEYGHPFYITRGGMAAKLTKWFVILASALTLGRFKWRYNNLTYILDLPVTDASS